MKIQTNDSPVVIVDKNGARQVGVCTQADLDRARADGYRDGFRHGKQSRVPITNKDRCEHGVLWSMECLSCGLPEYVAATPPETPVVAREAARNAAREWLRGERAAFYATVKIQPPPVLMPQIQKREDEAVEQLAAIITRYLGATTSPSETPKSSDAWREWFDRMGHKASPEVVNATADLVTNERLAALVQGGVLPSETAVGGEARHHKHCSIWTVTTSGKRNPCDCVCQCTHSMFEHIRPGEHYWYEDCAVDNCPCMKFTAAPVHAAGDDEGEWCDDCRAYTHTPNCPSYTGRNQ